jgi:type III secretion protein C
MTEHGPRWHGPLRAVLTLTLAALWCAFAAHFADAQVVRATDQEQSPEATKLAPGATKADAPSRARSTAPQRSRHVWASPRFTYRAEKKRLSEVLQDFASSQSLPAVIAEGLDGSVTGDFNSPPEAFLDALSKTYGLLWYHDGAALYFYPSSAIQSRLFRLKGFERSQVTALLQSLGLGDSRYPLRYSNGDSTLLVYGPPRHIELVGAALEQLDAGAADRNRPIVRVVPLRYASAADRMQGDQRLPGLATTLNGLYGAASEDVSTQVASKRAQPDMFAQQRPQPSPQPLPAQTPEKLRPLQGLFGADRPLQDLIARRSQAAPAESPNAATAAGPASTTGDAPVFRADEGTNSVLVLARPQRMAEYIELINQLDVRQTMVELEATIIDISSDSVESLGVTWSAEGQRGSVSVTPLLDGTISPFRIGTLWSNAGRELLARIDALTAEGKASIVAKPKLLGVSSRPAVMKERRIVVVRVPGNLEANLFQLEAGTLLQMTPYVSTHNAQTRIRLSLYIEDGGFEERVVDGVPVLKRMEISTEAHVLEGESILVGGITTTLESTQNNGVPGLSKIPFLGALFRSNSDKRVRKERLFLITPRVIRDVIELPGAVRSD